MIILDPVANLHSLDLGLDKVEDESLVGLDVLVHAAQLAEGAAVLPEVADDGLVEEGLGRGGLQLPQVLAHAVPRPTKENRKLILNILPLDENIIT